MIFGSVIVLCWCDSNIKKQSSTNLTLFFGSLTSNRIHQKYVSLYFRSLDHIFHSCLKREINVANQKGQYIFLLFWCFLSNTHRIILIIYLRTNINISVFFQRASTFVADLSVLWSTVDFLHILLYFQSFWLHSAFEDVQRIAHNVSVFPAVYLVLRDDQTESFFFLAFDHVSALSLASQHTVVYVWLTTIQQCLSVSS